MIIGFISYVIHGKATEEMKHVIAIVGNCATMSSLGRKRRKKVQVCSGIDGRTCTLILAALTGIDHFTLVLYIYAGIADCGEE